MPTRVISCSARDGLRAVVCRGIPRGYGDSAGTLFTSTWATTGTCGNVACLPSIDRITLLEEPRRWVTARYPCCRASQDATPAGSLALAFICDHAIEALYIYYTGVLGRYAWTLNGKIPEFSCGSPVESPGGWAISLRRAGELQMQLTKTTHG